MKTQISYMVLLGLFAVFSSCDHDIIHADGEVTSVHYNIDGYNGLRVSDAFNVHVNFSDIDEDIRIEANDNLHEKIVVERDGDVLIIRLQNHTSIKGRAVLNAYITTSNLSTFWLNGASRLALENQWNSQIGKIEVSDASDFNGEVDIDHLDAELNGASTINLYGKVSTLDAELSGSSDLLDYDLDISHLDIGLSGASAASVSVEGTISVKASGASSLNYKGDAAIIKSELSGSSNVIKKD